MTSISLGLEIPNTVGELAAYWNGHQIDLVGYHTPKRPWTRQRTIHTWNVDQLPTVVTWDCDTKCVATGFRYDNGPDRTWDDEIPIYLEPKDRLTITIRP